MTRLLGQALLFLVVFGVAVFLLNTDLRAPESEAKPLIIAHDDVGGT